MLGYLPVIFMSILSLINYLKGWMLVCNDVLIALLQLYNISLNAKFVIFTFLVGAIINVYILLELKCQSPVSCLKLSFMDRSNAPGLGNKQCLLLQLFSALLKESVILMLSVRKRQVGNSTQIMQIIFIIT